MSVSMALDLARKYADGGDVSVPFYAKREAEGMTHTGPLISTVPGRTDKLPISVPPNAYVMPADIVSGLPGAEGNSLAGHRILNQLFGSGPYGSSMPHRASGGKVESGKAVPIIAAGGEHVISPDVVARLGNGDVKMGHKVLDHFVKLVREQNIKTLKKLPGPVKK